LTEFIHYFTKIDGLSGKILMEHVFFGQRVYRCERFNIINDDEKIGIRVMGQDVCIRKSDMQLHKMYDKMFVFADNFLQLTIIVNEM
jgi:hypothetical protein